MNEPTTQTTTRYQPPDALAVADSRAALISRSLKSVARRARTPRNILAPLQAAPERRWQHVFAWAVLASFGLVVLLPNLVAGVYLAFIASDQYATETRFAVRGGEPSLLDRFGGLMGIPSLQRVQDSLIISDYVRGRGMVAAVDQALNLRHLFARDDIDLFSRFDPKSSDEELMYYWRRHVEVNIDSMSGIITVVVRAFTPQDSLDIANKIVSLSEALVNELGERSRRDALQLAKAELDRASQNLQDKTNAMRKVRDTEGVLDTQKTSEAMIKLVGDLRLQLLRMQQEYSAQRETISADAPQLRVLAARISSMKEQIEQLEKQMTGTGDPKTGTLASAIGRFDREALEKSIAEKQYVAAASAFELARIQLESQNVYLATFLKPVLAQEALYPRRLWLWSIVLIVTLLLWGGGVGGAVLARNHMAA